MAKLNILLIIAIILFTNEICGQWQSDVRLTNANGNSYTSDNNAQCIAIDSNVIHIVWVDYRDGNAEIYYKRSSNNGQTWNTDVRLTLNSSLSFGPSISVFGDNINIFWCDERNGNGEIYYKYSSDGGLTFEADIRLTNSILASKSPCAYTLGQNIHLVWEDWRHAGGPPPGQPEIYYKKSTNSGISWGADTRLTNNPAGSYKPSIIATGQIVIVVWEDLQNNNNSIFYKGSTDNGITWGGNIQILSNFSGASTHSSASISGNSIHVACENFYNGNDYIYYTKSTNLGQNWASGIQLVNTVSHFHLNPFVEASGDKVHLAWYDYRNGNNEIYYKRSIDAGINWSGDTRLTNDTSDSKNPFLTTLDSAVHLIWFDNRDGNNEIYYKRNPTGNPIGINNISSDIPNNFKLEQNYPNPFNPETKIKFQIPAPAMVNISVYDILGRRVESLVHENLNLGVYEVNWNASNYPSGVYYYKLTADNFSETRKMILLK